MLVSFAFGWISIACWIVAYYPQARLNFLLKKSEAMSIVFLICWIYADSFNLISCFLLDQLYTQKILSIIFVAFDAVLVYQYFYYQRKENNAKPLPIVYTALEIIIYVFALIFVVNNIIWAGVHGSLQITSGTANIQQCPSSGEISKGRSIAGDIIAYLTIPGYLASRPAQISRNCRRKTTDGLAIGFFILVICANGTQIISMFTGSTDSKTLIRKIPFILGCIFPWLCDIVVLTQICVYDVCKKETRKIKAESDDKSETELKASVVETVDASSIIGRDAISTQ